MINTVLTLDDKTDIVRYIKPHTGEKFEYYFVTIQNKDGKFLTLPWDLDEVLTDRFNNDDMAWEEIYSNTDEFWRQQVFIVGWVDTWCCDLPQGIALAPNFKVSETEMNLVDVCQHIHLNEFKGRKLKISLKYSIPNSCGYPLEDIDECNPYIGLFDRYGYKTTVMKISDFTEKVNENKSINIQIDINNVKEIEFKFTDFTKKMWMHPNKSYSFTEDLKNITSFSFAKNSYKRIIVMSEPKISFLAEHATIENNLQYFKHFLMKVRKDDLLVVIGDTSEHGIAREYYLFVLLLNICKIQLGNVLLIPGSNEYNSLTSGNHYNVNRFYSFEEMFREITDVKVNPNAVTSLSVSDSCDIIMINCYPMDNDPFIDRLNKNVYKGKDSDSDIDDGYFEREENYHLPVIHPKSIIILDAILKECTKEVIVILRQLQVSIKGGGYTYDSDVFKPLKDVLKTNSGKIKYVVSGGGNSYRNVIERYPIGENKFDEINFINIEPITNQGSMVEKRVLILES